MYEYIKGKVTLKETDYLVIENQGIGYKIHTSINSLSKVGDSAEDVCVYTYLHVREDMMQLYGFMDKEEKKIFLMLIGISGIGPKVGLSILSTLKPETLAVAIGSGDVKTLSKANGIGKKTAQRIVLELKDKFKDLDNIDGQSTVVNTGDSNEKQEEAKTALMVLGYSARDSQIAINKVYKKEDKLELIIRKALNYLNS